MLLADQCLTCRQSCLSDRRTDGHFERDHRRHFVICCSVNIISTLTHIASLQYSMYSIDLSQYHVISAISATLRVSYLFVSI